MKEYLLGLIKDKKRMDGRGLSTYREPITIETGISKKAEGSARVKIGNTEVNVGVKMELGTPYPDSPDEGTIIVTAELIPLSNPNFESGPPGIQATELARIVDRGIRESHYLDFKKLCVKKGEKIWMVLIDIYSINDEGNLFDAAALGAIAALRDAKVPVIKDDKVQYGELTAKKLPLDKEAPILMTIHKLGDEFIVDPISAEEEAVSARLSIAIKGDRICAMQKGGADGLSLPEVEKAIDLAYTQVEELKKALK
ncbi:RNA-binding protein [archaeon]|nr:RNA-binding protein [archaeon]